jgi:hypothetical protein
MDLPDRKGVVELSKDRVGGARRIPVPENGYGITISAPRRAVLSLYQRRTDGHFSKRGASSAARSYRDGNRRVAVDSA